MALAPRFAWTVLVYMAADNNLERAALDDLVELARVAPPDDVAIVVELDRSSSYSVDALAGVGDFSGAKRLRLTREGFTELADLGEPNTGAEGSLARFLGWGLSAFPSERSALVLWNHGAGWRGYGSDEASDQDNLSIAELHGELTEGLRVASVPRLDLLGFDACLMANYGAVHSLAPFARYMIASEEYAPSHGWDYSSLALLEHDAAEVDAPTLARHVMTAFERQARSSGKQPSTTIALLDMASMPALDSALELLRDDIERWGEAELIHLAHAATRAEHYGSHADAAKSMAYVDLADLMLQLGKLAPELLDDTQHVVDAVLRVAMDARHGSHKAGSHGLSVYLPELATHFDATYDTVDSKQIWVPLLNQLYSTGLDAAARCAGQATHLQDCTPLFAGGVHTVGPSFRADPGITCGDHVCQLAGHENILNCPADCTDAASFQLPTELTGQVCLGDYLVHGSGGSASVSAHMCPAGTHCAQPWTPDGQPAAVDAACVLPAGAAVVSCGPNATLAVSGQLFTADVQHFDAADVSARVFFRFGYYDAERHKVRLFGKAPAQLDRSTGQVHASFTQRTLMLLQGDHEYPVYAETELIEGIAQHSVSIHYRSSANAASYPGSFHVTTELESGAVLGQSLFVHFPGGASEVELEAGAEIELDFPELGIGDNPHIVADATTDEPVAGFVLTIATAQPLRFRYDALENMIGHASLSPDLVGFTPSERAYLELDAQSLSGRGDRVYWLGVPSCSIFDAEHCADASQIPDCHGVCAPRALLGDGVCNHDGPDFACHHYAFDRSDCTQG